jgi:hypothetical protein
LSDLGTLEYRLSKFIRNAGLSPGRLEMDGGELLELLGTTDAQQVYDRIVGLLDELEENQYNEVLRNAFGLGYSKKIKLSERRAEWIEHMKYPISENTIRRWEQRALKVLVRKLASSIAAEPWSQVIPTAKSEPSEEVDTVTLRQEINDLKRQLGEQNELLQEIIKRLPPE